MDCRGTPSDLVRTQILLEKKQRFQLIEIADKTGVSFSAPVRDFLNKQLRVRTYDEMRRAAVQLYGEYTNNENLTAMTALNGEDFDKG